MQIDITGHHVEITDALRQHTIKLLERLNSHRETSLQNIRVVLQVSKNVNGCGIMTRYNQEEFVVNCQESDMYAAIDRAVEKMERQLQNAKGRKLARRSQ
ncbi:ribosome-associated translation inhibitor RaiA [Candidatus Persebacteraceae bacterium Df01]|jgi:putative sigma-54 modulation protein|uniref:Ribosome-associated translation inhibitor RaiA n=1 Tax=Candidatus Doriopsillibacter californiensis TaxID=2970740 RepID=A0ABT7QL66_9GAMM|nr:ribosome-associated translation inhibitor RaiA [Candidatus Persebacteraceae bacterium Df01]